MTTPQQPDLATRAVPDDNQPGHHPTVEQDKPDAPPRLPRRHHRFAFRREPAFALAGLPFGVTESNSYLDVDDDRLEIRFGPWTLSTSTHNIESAQRTGPFRWWKVGGPPRVSLRDRGITFATNAQAAVCVRFREPVPAALPQGWFRHPAVTVTVDGVDDLARFLTPTP